MNLSNFDTYPFPVIALNEDRLIIYRNYISEKLFPQIHLRASIKMYSDVQFCSGFTTNSFFDTQRAMFSYILDNFQILVILPVSSFKRILGSEDEYKSVVSSVLNSKSIEPLNQKSRASLRQVAKAYKKATFINLFSELFSDKENTLLNEKLSLQSVLKTILKTFSFKTDFNFDFEDVDENIICINNRQRLLLTIINAVNFIYINSKTMCAKATLCYRGDAADISFEFQFNENKERLLRVLHDIYQRDVSLDTVVLGFDRDNSDIKVNISDNGSVCALKIEVPVTKTGEYIFCDNTALSRDIEKIVDFYINLNH